jgi:hypothetical protein
MIDVEKAVMAGLVLPAADACLRCHENTEPGHRGVLERPAPADLFRFVHEWKRD